MCALSKLSSAKEHIEVTVDMDEMDLTSAETKATYNEIRDWILEKLKVCFAHYEKNDIGNALVSTHELFKKLAVRVADVNEYLYPQKAENTASEYLKRL
ncbi:MAG: aminoglycoside 6-adenylyltransferase [Lachnospiraceae bacterium]|nr:aminoglycoside 6-adenylyltransferase [Lachnospiraceae bacterium]